MQNEIHYFINFILLNHKSLYRCGARTHSQKIGNEKFNKFTLVIGNLNYRFSRSLKNLINDVERMKKLLKKLVLILIW